MCNNHFSTIDQCRCFYFFTLQTFLGCFIIAIANAPHWLLYVPVVISLVAIKFHLIKIHVTWQFDSCRLLKLFCLRISWGSFEISWWSFTSVLNRLLNWLIHKQLALFWKDTKNNERSLLQEYRNICAKRFYSNTAVFVSSISFSWFCLFEMKKKQKLTQNFTHGNRNGLWYFTEEYWILYWN